MWSFLKLFVFCTFLNFSLASSSESRTLKNVSPLLNNGRILDGGQKIEPYAAPNSCGEKKLKLKDGDHGFFTSPNYPSAYGGGVECEWRYETEDPKGVIVATIFDMKTKSSFLADASDSLLLSLNGNWNESQRFSGNLGLLSPLVLVTDGNALVAKFKSSPLSQGARGFKVGYFVRDSGAAPVTQPGHDVAAAAICYVPVSTPCIFPTEGLKEVSDLSGINRTNPNPFLVALVLDDNQFCAGTLVSQKHVLTSAHCTRGVSQIDMIFGTRDLDAVDAGVQKRTANSSSIYENPSFDPHTGSNDISVIELQDPVQITRFVEPAALPPWSFMGTTFEGTKGNVSGWGDAKSGVVYTEASDKTIRLGSNVECAAINKFKNGLAMCSPQPSKFSTLSSSTCQADSGSPIVKGNSNYCNSECENTPAPAPTDTTNPNPGPQKPPRPQKPNNKPQKPNKPYGKNRKNNGNLLLGIVSYGSCDKGLSFTRITSQFDFLQKYLTLSNDYQIIA